MGEKEVDAFIQQTAALQAEKGYGEVTRWYFSKSGLPRQLRMRNRYLLFKPLV